MEKPDLVKISNLVKEYGGFIAVNDVSFEIKAGEIVGLLGPNGAGKTTIINMVLGILEQTSGSIKILGKEVKDHRSEIAKQMNFAAVYAHLPANLSVYENLHIFGLLYEVKDLKNKIKTLMKEFDLEKFANFKSGLLSSGESSRLSLAKARLNDPCLMLLDEPTASLDPDISQTVRKHIKRYVEEKNASVLWTSHNMREIESVCDRVMFLSHGKIVLSGDPKTLASEHNQKDLEELFIKIAREPINS